MPDLDQIIDYTLADDAASLRRLIAFTSKPCTSRSDQVDLPLCRPGEAEGTPIDTITETTTGVCRIAVQTIQRRADEISASGTPFARVRLYAVYRAAASGGGDAHTAVFVRDSGDPQFAVLAASLRLEHGRIVALEIHCGQTASELVAAVPAADFVIRPRE